MTQPGFVHPEGPTPDAVEWPGTMIGVSNVITRTKSRTKVYDKTIDRQPGKFDSLIESVRRMMAGRELYVHDVVVHGVRVRAHTNSAHLADFWKVNWFGVEEWKAATGARPREVPQVNVYAFGRAEDQPEAAYYSRRNNAVIFFNTAYYGQLKSWVLGAVGRILAEESGIHSIHGAAVERKGRGILYIAPTGTGKSTSSYGMMDFDGTRFHSDDWVYVRYAYPLAGGEMVSPCEVRAGDESVSGYRCHGWLERNRSRRDARVGVLSLANESFEVAAGELDLERPAAYAYTSEKVFYLRSNLVENYPQYAAALFESRLENVPDATEILLRSEEPKSAALAGAAVDCPAGRRLAGLPKGMLQELLVRLYSFENARAMLRIDEIFGRDRIFADPMEPLRLDAVMLLKRDAEEDTVLRTLSLEDFCSRLILGTTPDGQKEIAYNAYRAVDDAAERSYVNRLEAAGGNLYRRHISRLESGADVPETFAAEFELFRLMHGRTRAYELNTILQRKTGSKREAVLATMEIIKRVLETLPTDAHRTLHDYEGWIG